MAKFIQNYTKLIFFISKLVGYLATSIYSSFIGLKSIPEVVLTILGMSIYEFYIYVSAKANLC